MLFFICICYSYSLSIHSDESISRSHLPSKFQIFLCLLPDVIVCAFVLWENHSLYAKDKKKRKNSFDAVVKSSGRRMKCVCVCMITNWDRLEYCMQYDCWNVIKILFFFSFIFPPVDIHRRFGCFEGRVFPGWLWRSK